jgi:hypothetical protein
VIEDIKRIVVSFSSCFVIHTNRAKNVAAHCLARS